MFEEGGVVIFLINHGNLKNLLGALKKNVMGLGSITVLQRVPFRMIYVP